MIKDYFRFAYQSTTQRRMRSWLTMTGIFIGIAAVVALISLSSGLQSAISQQFLHLGSDKLIVQAAGGGFGPPGTGVPKPLTKEDQQTIDKTPGVEISVGRLIRTVQLEFNDRVRYSYAVSFPKENDQRQLVIEANNYKMGLGKFIDNDQAQEVIVGHDFAEDFFDTKIALRDQIKIQGEEFKVVGILQKSGNPQQDSTLVLPEGTLRNILKIKENYDLIPVKIKAGENIKVVRDNLAKALRKSRGVEESKEDFTIETPEQIIATLNTIIMIIQGVLVGIAGISLLIGGIGIMNTMYTAVLERTKEIGIMKAVGAKNSHIQLLFLVESGILGLCGGIIGVTLGIIIAKLVELIAFQQFGSALIQADINMGLILGALLFAFMVGAVSGVFPARQAAKLHPVEALRQ